MATRMQQRRGTAAQWTEANPILAVAEIGFESDTGQFKMGDGVNHWADLSYFKNLQDLGGSLDDYILLTEKGAADGVATLDSTGKIPSSQLPDELSFDAEVTNAVSTAMSTEVTNRNSAIATAKSEAISTAASDATTKANNAKSGAEATAANALAAHEADTTNIHGIANTAALATKAYVDNAAEAAATAAVTGIVDGAPELINTINELAAAINDDPSFANTVLSSVDAAQQAAQGFATQAIGNAISQEVDDRNNAISVAIGTEVSDRNAAISDAVANAISSHKSDTINVHGIADTSVLVTQTDLNDTVSNINSAQSNAIATHGAVTTNVHGIADTSALATKTYANSKASDAQSAAEATAASALSDHASDTTDIHGIANTAALATKSYADGKASDAQSAAANALASHEADTTNIHGIADTSLLATKSYADSAVSTHEADTTNVHGIADTSALATKTYADSAVSTHLAVTTNVHGIADTSALATKTYADNAVSTHDAVTTNVHGIANTAALATKAYADSAVSTHEADTTNVHGIADTSKIVLKDANTQTISGSLTITGDLTVQGNTLTVSANSLVINDPMIYMGENNTGNSVDLGIVSSYTEANSYVHTGLVRDASDAKWKLFTGVTDEPGSTVNFAQGSLDKLAVGPLEASSLTVGNVSNTEIGYLDGVTSAIQTQIDAKLATSTAASTYAPIASPTFTGTVSGITKTMVGLGNVDNTSDANKPVSTATQTALDLKAPKAAPTFTGLVTVSSSGVAFTDGTQTAEGVPSRTPIVQKTASYTLSALTERDSLIEISSASAVTLTVPANSSVAYPVGTSIDILQTGAGQITVAAGAGVTVNATPGLKLRTQWSGATLFKRATDTWVLYGDLMA